MILINEWLPNPKGSDAQGEWVELVNTGDVPVNLQNWQLVANKKSATLGGVLAPRGYAVLTRSETKLVLGNQNGEVRLYAPGGRPVDQAMFRGSAPEGQSFSRFGAHFRFSEPTPGQTNQPVTAMTQASYPLGQVVRPGSLGYALDKSPQVVRSTDSFWDIMLLALGVALALALAVRFLFKQYDQIYILFFPRDHTTGSGLGTDPLG